MRRIEHQGFGRKSADPADQDTSELIDAADRGTGIINRRRNGAQSNVDDLDDAEFNVLLHRPHRADIERSGQFHGTVAIQSAASRNHQQRNAGRNKVADRPGYSHAQVVRPGKVHEAPCVDETDIAGHFIQNRKFRLVRLKFRNRGAVMRSF